MSKPVCLDLFSGAGGAARGYQQAGFLVHGVDTVDQPRYGGDRFFRGDALEYAERWGHLYDFIHASPPCQFFTRIAQRLERSVARRHVNLIPETRDAILATGLPYVIENVVEALPHMLSPVRLCGSSFGLDVRRHRLFESNVLLFGLPCDHSWQTPRFRSLDGRREKLASVVGVHGHVNYKGEAEIRKQAMGIHWMNMTELSQAIPPAYTKFLGEQVILFVDPSTEKEEHERCL